MLLGRSCALLIGTGRLQAARLLRSGALQTRVPVWRSFSSEQGRRKNQGGSQFLDYDETSQHYDSGRHAVASAAVESLISDVSTNLGTPVSDLVALDAGCGTGNYSVAIAEMGVGTVHAVDANKEMLQKLRQKVQGGALESNIVIDSVDFSGQAQPFSLADESVNVTLISQVTHHLVIPNRPDPFENVKKLLADVGRVTSTGGGIVIQTSVPEQQSRGFWWADIIPLASNTLAARYWTVRTWFISSPDNALCKQHTGFFLCRQG